MQVRTSGLYPKYLLCDPHQQYHHHRSTTSVILASTTNKTDFLNSLIEIRPPQPKPQPQPQLQPQPQPKPQPQHQVQSKPQPKPLTESCSGVCSGCNQARRDSTWFTDRVRAHISVAKNHCQHHINCQLAIARCQRTQKISKQTRLDFSAGNATAV